MPRLFLHIGLDKTGTSAVQRFLHARRKALRKAGVLYPLAGLRGYAHHDYSRLLATTSTPDDPNGPPRDELRAALREESRAARCDSVVLSSEDFSLLGDATVARAMFRDFDTTVVVYLRRHDRWWASVYNQAVRMVADPPWERGIEAFIAYNHLHDPLRGDYRRLVEQWAQTFGYDNLVVRPYETCQNPGGIVADFVRSIGLRDLESEAAAWDLRVNPSLSADSLQLMDLLQRARIDPRLRAKLHRKLLALPRAVETPSPMGGAYARALIDANREDYAHIARRFLGRADGRLFLDPEPDGSDDAVAPLSNERLVTALLDLVYG